MPRRLWLKVEPTSESDAILHLATAEQVALAWEFLVSAPDEQKTTAKRLQSLLDQQQQTPPMSRKAIPCHRPQGLLVLLPWRLAAWLVRVLDSPADTVNDVQCRLSRWLSEPTQVQASREEHKYAVAQPSLLG